MNIIKEIPSKETYPVRQPVLRKDKPIESCIFEGDDIESTHHFGLFNDEKLIGIISLFKQSNLIFAEKDQAQIRGMAILENNQKKGFGEALVKHCENYCKSNKTELIWFNARTAAVGFYRKLNYEITGKPFDIKDVGEHYLMFKKL
ncbi:ribosomal protein S18 acetylase RimI-like enzyme [Flavobacterium sp. HSC-32F16]|uniref:GNAT family N-acetyltransferase n=1 Tax=Flavobacterium sp. HSC-32F16 TaxID=2910964 RepID=UPI0020A3F9ED|nr:GNAT family N-acetyltransferase [Flavobacterium sp. HSC-32F16]MCP2029901.1 ribosomal protein S18 acetylase RimI-like enzyme [Flavobacterium sp. HSC-32F16]